MSNTLNAIYTRSDNNINTKHITSNKKTSSKAEDFNSVLSAQLDNVKNTEAYTYVNAIKNCYPKTTVTVKSMTASDVKNYYEEWKKQPINYSGFKHDIIVSPKVLEKMENDPKYAEQMMAKIQKAAIPEGFGGATLYEYKVIVRDDGQIETMSCADWNNTRKNNDDDDDDEKKAEKKKIRMNYFYNDLYKQEKEISGNGLLYALNVNGSLK